MAVTCGWWFVRDLVVYGHLIGSTDLAGAHFGPAGFHGLATARSLGEGVVTYLWLPTEYYRNLIHAPAALRVAVAALVVGVLGSAVLLVASERRARSRSTDPPVADPDQDRARAAWQLLGLTGVFVVGGWAVLYVTTISFPARAAFVALPLWFSVVGWVVDRMVGARSARVQAATLALVVVGLVMLDAWTLWAVHGIGPTASSFL